MNACRGLGGANPALWAGICGKQRSLAASASISRLTALPASMEIPEADPLARLLAAIGLGGRRVFLPEGKRVSRPGVLHGGRMVCYGFSSGGKGGESHAARHDLPGHRASSGRFPRAAAEPAACATAGRSPSRTCRDSPSGNRCPQHPSWPRRSSDRGKQGKTLLRPSAWAPYGKGFERQETRFVCDNGAEAKAQRGIAQTVELNQTRPEPIVAVCGARPRA